MMKNLWLWLLITMGLIFVLIFISVLSNFESQKAGVESISYSQFLKDVQAGNINSVTIQNQTISAKTQNNKIFTTYMPKQDKSLLSILLKNNVAVVSKPPEQPMHIFISWFPILLIFLIII